MTELTFVPSNRRPWHALRTGTHAAHVVGWAATGGAVLSGESLGRYVVDKVQAAVPFSDVLGELNGAFAVVLSGPGVIHLGVDRVRSVPLFYRVNGTGVRVSDDTRALGQDDCRIDPDSAIEYVTAGFVTGPHTLFKEITGLQSGESVSWVPESQLPKSCRYYRYVCSFDGTSSVERQCEALDEIMVTVFKRFIAALNGRQVALALSAGADSRVVAWMLRRLNYDNVLCYCYGLPGNRELERSRDVAAALKYDWVHTPYSREMWREILHGDQLREYWGFSSNGVSFPHSDGWPAVRMLIEGRHIANDAVFVTGILGDFISGGHLKYLFNPVWQDEPHDLFGAILKKHYSMWDHRLTIDGVRRAIDHRISEVLDGFPKESDEDFACLYDYWEWQERQSKHIVNSMRVYEFFGYSWAFPFGDRALLDFWTHVPMALKLNQYLYFNYVSSFESTGLFQDKLPTGLWRREDIARQMALGRSRSLYWRLRHVRLFAPLLDRYLKYRKHEHEYQAHPLGEARAYGKWGYLLLNSSKRHAQALSLDQFLRYQYGLDPKEVIAAAASRKPVVSGAAT